MKLLIYSHSFAPSIGGVETTYLLLPNKLAEVRDSTGAPEFEITLVTQTPRGSFDDSALPFRTVRQPSFLQLLRLVRSSDVVHIAGPALAPLSLSLLLGKPVVVEHHGFQTICPNGQLLIDSTRIPCPGHFMAHRYYECLRCNSTQGWLSSCKLWLLTFLRRFLCARVTASITETQWLAGLLFLPRIITITRGFDPCPPLSRPSPPSETPVIIFMGRLVTTKGVHLLFEAAKILREQNRPFELLVIGDGPERAALEQFSKDVQLGVHVRFTGRLDGEALDAVFAKASIVVVPSLGGEVFGLVVVENMLRGLPIVASDLGAFVEVLGGTGLTFRTGDPADLAAALARLLDDPSGAAGLGQQARRRSVDFFNSSRMIEGHSRIYRVLRGVAKD